MCIALWAKYYMQLIRCLTAPPMDVPPSGLRKRNIKTYGYGLNEVRRFDDGTSNRAAQFEQELL